MTSQMVDDIFENIAVVNIAIMPWALRKAGRDEAKKSKKNDDTASDAEHDRLPYALRAHDAP